MNRITVYCRDINAISSISRAGDLKKNIFILFKKDNLSEFRLDNFEKFFGEDDVMELNKKIERGKNGKPFLKGSSINFSISKTEGAKIYAVSKETELGIDMEKMDEEKIFKHKNLFFSKEEIKIIDSNKNIINFFKFWTRKEALLKALGIGIIDTVNKISLASDINIIDYPYDSNQFDKLYIYSGIIEKHYYFSLCSNSPKKIYLNK